MTTATTTTSEKKKSEFPKAHQRSISMLHKNGITIGFPSVDGCKDQLQQKICRQLYPDYANLYGLAGGLPLTKCQADLTNPGFIVYVGKEGRERTAAKFLRMIHQIEALLDVPTVSTTELPEVDETCKSGPIVARTDQWWLKSPISVTLYFNFLRMAPYMKMRENLQKFLTRIRQRTVADGDTKAVTEASYIETAINNGNLAAFFGNTLPCMNREGFSDWLLATATRGICNYNAKDDKKFPLKEEELYNLRVGKEVEKARKKNGIAWK
jgi:hypothetical protein